MTITDFSITIRQSGAISLVDVSGRLTSFETGTLRDSISRLLKQGHKDIILNLTDLQYLDSSGIGELARVYVSVVKQSGQMKVIGLSSKRKSSKSRTSIRSSLNFPMRKRRCEAFQKIALSRSIKVLDVNICAEKERSG